MKCKNGVKDCLLIHNPNGECDNCKKGEREQEKIVMLNKLAQEVHQNAVEHGWWEEERSFGEIIALCHSELSEALEEHRKGFNPDATYYRNTITRAISPQCFGEFNKPEGIPTELADCIIRILDYCGKENIDIDEAIRIKHEYNKTRPYRHGGKVI